MDPGQEKHWIKKRKERREALTPDHLFAGLRRGDIGLLSAAITLIESMNPEHRKDADDLLKKCLPFSGNSVRVGITGVPGVGKSTFIEAFGKHVTHAGKRLAILAVDPTSGISKGSILGDKTRMNELASRDDVFIRPTPAGETLGGVAHRTRETIVLCEAAGFDFILIETVGVGQSETMVKSMVDFFLLLMLSGAGDELQGIKKGIMEMADAIVITKADGDNESKAKLAAAQYRNALHLFALNDNGWIPKVATCSALENKRIAEVYDTIAEFCNHTKANQHFEANRNEQNRIWFREGVREMILDRYFNDPAFKKKMKKIEADIEQGKLTSFQGAEYLLNVLNDEGKI